MLVQRKALSSTLAASNQWCDLLDPLESFYAERRPQAPFCIIILIYRLYTKYRSRQNISELRNAQVLFLITSAYILYIPFTATLLSSYHRIKIMRSLFTQDIPGALPRNRYYDKQLYLQRHLKEVERFGPKNPEHHRVFEWHQPLKRPVEPIDKNASLIKPHSYLYQDNALTDHSHMSQSLPLSRINQLQVTGKVTEGISLKRESSVLSQAAKKSLSQSFNRELGENPYFPHVYGAMNLDNESKLTGRRDWNPGYSEQIDIPPASRQYFPKWS